jgi:ATP-dependent RNA helicase DeaD
VDGSEATPRSFHSMGLSERMLKSLDVVGYENPTPIQAEFIPKALTGRDCIGQARTGTGKTCAFVIPLLERIDHSLPEVQSLVLCPTRELSEQVAAEAKKLAAEHNCEPALLVGGRPMGRQLQALERCPSIVIGTPGRVIDLMQRGKLNLSKLRIAVLDEADRMLDIGFRPAIEKIMRQCPKERQTLLLSATMPPTVARLANRYMSNPDSVDLSGDSIGGDQVEQYYCTVDHKNKFGLLVRLLISERPEQAIVFVRTKRGVDEIYRRLKSKLPDVAAIHGDLQQSERDRVMKRLRSGELRLLIATDVVGRGIDVTSISHIINYDVPEYCDDYVHRVGRTGRISSEHQGRAFTFVTKEEGDQLTQIEIRINKMLEQFQVPGYQPYTPREVRTHVETKGPASGGSSFPVNEDDWCEFSVA